MHQKSKLNSLIAVTALCAATVAFATPAGADEISVKGRAIFEQHHHAVVTVQAVEKVPAIGRRPAQEVKQDITGTVIDPSGLTVLALSSVDPSELLHRVSPDETLNIEVLDIKFLQEDGTEVPAEIVLRDKDLDLAFIRPKTKPATPMDAVDLSKSSHAQVLDPLITLNRLKRAVSRAYCASVERVSAVVQKPRTYYVPDGAQTDTTPGSPAFALDGNVVGVFVMRAVSGQGQTRADNVAVIILPAEDIAKAAAQAPAEAKPDTTKTSAPKADGPKEPAK